VSIQLVFADLGDGAMLAVLCDQCWHRMQYRAELKRRLLAGEAHQVHVIDDPAS
jgi:hypothetical protein